MFWIIIQYCFILLLKLAALTTRQSTAGTSVLFAHSPNYEVLAF